GDEPCCTPAARRAPQSGASGLDASRDRARDAALGVSVRGPIRRTAVAAPVSDTGADVFDQRTAWKIDFIICKLRPFSQEEFGRRRRVVFEGLTLWIATVEDVLIAKLEWASKGESRRQLDDCAQLLRVRGAELDRAYSVDQRREERALGRRCLTAACR